MVRLGRCWAIAGGAVVADLLFAEVEGGEVGEVLGDGGGAVVADCCSRGRGW